MYKKKVSAEKSSFYIDKLNKYGTSSKEAFKLAFSLIGKHRNKKLSDGSDDNLCYLFADFFQNKVLKIIEDRFVVDSIYFESPPSISDTHWSYFNLPISSVILSLMSCLKSNSPLELLPLNLLRILSPYIKSMKYAYITPILKKHNLDSSILSNYRPVSQLSSISKTM